MLTFNAERHEYQWDGQAIHGVTSILKDMGLTPPYAPGNHSDVGTRVHKLTEQVDQGMISPAKLIELADHDTRPFCEAHVAFLNDYSPEWLMVEVQLADPRPGRWFAGTLDRLSYSSRLGRQLTLWDVKCTSSLARVTEIQLAAYAELAAYRLGINVTEIALRVIQLQRNGRYTTAPDMKLRFTEWGSALNLWHWKNQTAARKGWE